jgi:argininosuccinate lyase
LIRGLVFDRSRLEAATSDPSLLATDAAEALVRAGVPFRDAHEQIAAHVREGTFEPPASGERPAPGPGGVREALAEARRRFS